MKKYIITIIVLVMCIPINAQNTNSGYFADGYLYRHELNPAFDNRQGYVSMAGLGNVNIKMNSNLRTDNILYNINGKTTTFLNPEVSTSEFLNDIKDVSKINANVRLDVLSVGFKGMGGYNNIGINLRSDINARIPKSIFSLAKEGPQNKEYDISDFGVDAAVYSEIALGHSHKINDKLRIGANMKFLIGGANVTAQFNKAKIILDQEAFQAVTNAKIHSSIKGLQYKTEIKERGPEGQKTEHEYVTEADIDNFKPNGFGMAFDLGVEYKISEYWSVSAALLDLGYIRWSTDMVASTNGDRYFTTDKYIFNTDEDADNSFENESDRLTEGLATLYELQDNGDMGARTTGIGATMNLGVEYTLPSYTKLKFGLLNTSHFKKNYSWTEFRLSANCAPTKIFSATANVAMGTFGTSFGWLLNFHPNGFNIYAGMDHTLGSLAKQGLPLSGRAHVNVGLNFPF
ncbi:MAG: DUF5723 family protein [Bacteroidaceae bacterium]|nr:DUF5723 family protein [Bacteroidaceae bacterium]